MTPATSPLDDLTDTDRPCWQADMLAKRLRLWLHRHRTRQHLARLDDHRLSDISLTNADRSVECQKWFWQQ